MKKQHILLLIGIVGILGYLVATIKVDVVYNSETIDTQKDISVMALSVERFLQNPALLPPPGTSLVRRDGNLEWANLSTSAFQITNVWISSVRVISGAPLLWSALDDDPTFTVQVMAIVTTIDGKQTSLRLTFWDYGLVTPWFVQSRGDGLKPISVIWD